MQVSALASARTHQAQNCLVGLLEMLPYFGVESCDRTLQHIHTPRERGIRHKSLSQLYECPCHVHAHLNCAGAVERHGGHDGTVFSEHSQPGAPAASGISAKIAKS